MFDMDSIEFSFDTRQPVACIETKCGLIGAIDLNTTQFDCLYNTSQRLEVPLFCVVYYNLDADMRVVEADVDHSMIVHIQYYVLAVNDLGKKALGATRKKMSELQYVEFLYRLRGEEVPAGLSLSTTFIDSVKIPAMTLRW